MERLQQIWERLAVQGIKSDKGDIHSYLPVYEEVLKPYREKEGNILEIGLFHGHSMRMWEAYFTKAKVYGIDCDEQPHGGMADLRPMIAEGTHNILIGDATSELFIRQTFRGKTLNVVIDDGNHHPLSQIHSYNLLSPYLADDGLYVIEDIENIDETREMFERMDSTKKIEIIDLRHIKNRYDDVIVKITDK